MNNSSAEWALTTTARLSSRISVDITCGPGGMTCEWSPDRPDAFGIRLTKKELRRYFAARHQLLERVAERMGGNILVVDV
jgi:hypothetical protein